MYLQVIFFLYCTGLFCDISLSVHKQHLFFCCYFDHRQYRHSCKMSGLLVFPHMWHFFHQASKTFSNLLVMQGKIDKFPLKLFSVKVLGRECLKWSHLCLLFPVLSLKVFLVWFLFQWVVQIVHHLPVLLLLQYSSFLL